MVDRPAPAARRTVRDAARYLWAVVLICCVATSIGVVEVVRASPGPAHAAPSRPGASATGDAGYRWAGFVDLVQAVAAGQRFLDDWVVDGRVVRHDQGGDTVSEGQAYAMTIAAGLGDEATFRAVWQWTRTELQRPDGLFSWRWLDGAVTDPSPAADADLLIAGALSAGARRFGDPSLSDAASRIAAALLAHSTTEVAGTPFLVAGPWAVESGTINPSYLVTPVMSALSWNAGPQWAEVAASSRLVLAALTADAPHLPPDWAEVSPIDTGQSQSRSRWSVTPAAPDGGAPIYGWEAVRIPVQMAADCAPSGRAIAARMWPFYLSRDVAADAVYALDGSVVDSSDHAVSIVGAAGSAWAAGAHRSSRVLLKQAEALNADHPTYYGAAWLALARLWLTTDLLGGCARS